jgi:peroxiredoxin
MPEIQIGDEAPDFILKSIDGQTQTLSECMRGKDSVLLVFLRHLG